MRRSVIAGVTCLVAVGLAAPTASAGVATFSGSCAITGTSTFDPPLTGTHQTIKYDFKSGPPAEGAADGTKCTGTLNGQPVNDVPVKATVTGEGDLSCSSGASTTPGKGAIVFADGSNFPFDFTFSAIATEVDFKAAFAGGGETTGHASFLHYAPPTALFDCSPAGGGLSALGFDATTEESSMAVNGTTPESNQQETATAELTTAERRRIAKRYRHCVKKAKKIENTKRKKKAVGRCKKARRRALKSESAD
jgi:hypothetical protein